MQGHDRFERRSLRDVLVAQSVLTNELADDLMSSARENNEPFGVVLVESGHMTSWDLAKTVATDYHLPMLPLAGFRFEKELADGVSPAVLYQYLLVPVGRFGKTWSFAVVEPPTRECLKALEESCGTSLFFFVAEVPEVQRLLREHIKVVDTSADQGWKDIFDVADKSILEGLPEDGN